MSRQFEKFSDRLVKEGFLLVPIAKGLRHPDYSGWADASSTFEAMKSFRKHHGRAWDPNKDRVCSIRMPKGWIVIDIDRGDDAEEIDSFMSPRFSDDWFGRGLHVRTPSGGRHVYFRIPVTRSRFLKTDKSQLAKRVLDLGDGNGQIPVEVACAPMNRGGFGSAILAPMSRFAATRRCRDKQKQRGLPKDQWAEIGDPSSMISGWTAPRTSSGRIPSAGSSWSS